MEKTVVAVAVDEFVDTDDEILVAVVAVPGGVSSYSHPAPVVNDRVRPSLVPTMQFHDGSIADAARDATAALGLVVANYYWH